MGKPPWEAKQSRTLSPKGTSGQAKVNGISHTPDAAQWNPGCGTLDNFSHDSPGVAVGKRRRSTAAIIPLAESAGKHNFSLAGWKRTPYTHGMSTTNHFRQAGRYAAQLDPAGFLRWVLGPAVDRYRFQGWLDPRTTASPDAPSPACDTVAELVERSVVAFHWAIGVAFPSGPDPELFGGLLEGLGRLWRERRPTGQPEQRFQIAAAVVHLAGTGRSSRVMTFSDGVRIALEVREVHVAAMEAAPLLDAIAAGTQSPGLLPWVPLMKGGSEPVLIAQWKTLAEQDLAKSLEYAAVALVFADLAEIHPAWELALEGWNVKESAQVLLWQEEARRRGVAEGKAACLIELLENRFKKIPGTVVTRVKGTEDMALLDEWFKAALSVATLAEFRKLLKDKDA
jgi:hypothetical protein